MALKILLAPETFNLGETSRGIEVAKSLKELGHQVRFMGYSKQYAQLVRDAGFELTLLEPELSEAEAKQLLKIDQNKSLRNPFTKQMLGQRILSERKLISSWQPDGVVIGSTFSLFISARAEQVPLMYVKPYATSRQHLAQMDTFPLTQGQSWVGEKLNQVAAITISNLLPRIRWIPKAFKSVANEHGVKFPKQTLAALDTDLDLLVSLFPRISYSQAGTNYKIVGPIYSNSEAELPTSILKLAKSTKPVVYFSLGSSGNRKLALQILNQIAELDLEIITPVGRFLSETDKIKIPQNVHVYDYLPAPKLAGLISASITHGGEGTVQTACASGVPFAGIGLQAEQRFNIQACVKYGNAIRFTPRDLNQRRLPAIVNHLLTDPQMRQAAKSIQPLAQPTGAKAAALEIIDFLHSHQKR